MKTTHKLERRARRVSRVRAKVFGSTERPRLSVHISNNNVTAQLIDDSRQHTLAYATSVGAPARTPETMTDKAVRVGTDIARQAKKLKLDKVVFDRGGRLYHGRVKALADTARKAGLEF